MPPQFPTMLAKTNNLSPPARYLQRTCTPVSAKIRIFPELSRTLEYAKLIEASGASLVAVHGRTREQKDAAAVRADWDAIKAVKDALSIPVLGNGDVQSRAGALRMMEYTGVDGVLSATPLLEDPRLFWEERSAGEPYVPLKCFEMAQEYLKMCEQYPVPARMVRVCSNVFQDVSFLLLLLPSCTCKMSSQAK
jgi:tRNA-dihydrouridine synthase 1